MRVDPGVSVLSQPNHPLRLAWLFATSVLVTGIIATAGAAVLYIVQQERTPAAPALEGGSVEAPEGLIIVLPVEDAKEFEDMTGFEPFIPERLPAATDTTPVMAVTLPDEEGNRVGRISFAQKSDEPTEGFTGPIVVLAQAKGKPGEGVDGVLKRVTSGTGRTVVATIPCGDLVIDIQLYFGPAPQVGDVFVTPYMHEVSTQFVDDMKAQCAR